MSLDDLERQMKRILSHIDEIEMLARRVSEDPEHYARRIRSEAEDIESLARKARNAIRAMKRA